MHISIWHFCYYATVTNAEWLVKLVKCATRNTILVISEVVFKANHLTDIYKLNSTGNYTNKIGVQPK